jgi:hypothetical protein
VSLFLNFWYDCVDGPTLAANWSIDTSMTNYGAIDVEAIDESQRLLLAGDNYDD